MKQRLKELSREKLAEILCKAMDILSEEQYKELEIMVGEAELYLDTEEYEDYSGGYWDPDWITEYYDNQDIGDKLMAAIRFAKDWIDDQRYTEANFIYEWLGI